MLPLPHVSGVECIRALAHFGYRVGESAAGLASLSNGANVVVVPESATLSPSLLCMILRIAKVDPLDFARILEPIAQLTPSVPNVA
jgi:hypothetical protein